ncbi:MAG: long-chain-acyl-CoA synthetase [Candidatus Binatia bacterium]
MSVLERALTTWTELQSLGRALPELPLLNPLGHRSCARLLQQLAAESPNQVGLAYRHERWTWKQIGQQANRYAHFAVQQHVRRGDVVALLMDNRPDYLCIVSGLNRAGIITALINTHVTGTALVHAIKSAKAKVLLVGSEHLGTIEPVLDALPGVSKPHNVWVQLDPERQDLATRFRLINDAVAASSVEELRQRPWPSTLDPMCYIYTSGTTGLPKAAIVSNQRWLEGALVFARIIGEMTAKDVLYMTLPLYHSTGVIAAWGAVVMSGATMGLRRKFSASRFWEDVRELDATIFIYIGELCRYLLAQPPTPPERRHHLRICIGNGLRADIWRKFQSRFRIPLIREYYGATEGNLGLCNLEGRPGMIGRLLPGVAVVRCDASTGAIIRNADGRCESVAVGERGLLLGRINTLMRFDGYLDRAATRKKVLRDVFTKDDAYFNTGDLVQVHDDGWVSFADRVGDTFRWKGENVSTHQVAEILSGAKGLREANVYGVHVNGAEGRAGMASVVVADGFDLAAFARYVVTNLASYERPYFLRVVPDMHITGTFKHCKVDYCAEGYDPTTVKDPLYYLDGKQYVPIDAALYSRLAAGEAGPR